MAVLWSLISIEDVIVLEYGPGGTTNYSRSRLLDSIGLKPENKNNLFTTHMREDDVVMGNASRLENAIVELDEVYHPKVIFVLASYITAVIGTDIQGICHYMQDRVSAQLIPVDTGSFKGDYTVGLREIYKLIAQEIPLPDPKKTQACNILGTSAGSYRIRSDIRELEDLLHKAFGIRMGAVLGSDSNLFAIEQMGGAALNLVLRAEALPCAEVLKNRFGTPLVYGSPYGYKGTLQWLKMVGSNLGKEADSALESALQVKAQNAVQLCRVAMMSKEHPAATVVGDYDLINGISTFLEDLGMKIAHKICNHSLRDIHEHDETIVQYNKEAEQLALLKELRGQLVFGDDITCNVIPQDSTGVCVSAPFIRRRQLATHMPIMGECGADWLLEKIYKYLES